MILLDTNFILSSTKQKTHLFEQLQELYPEKKIIVPSRVLDELEDLHERRDLTIEEREAAGLALHIFGMLEENEKIEVIDLEGKVDDILVDYANRHKGVILATLDRGIKQRLEGTGTIFLTLRQKKLVREI